MDTIGENVLLKEHARNAEIGIFIVTARLKSSGELEAGSATIPAGEHIIGVSKDGPENWTLALYSGQLDRAPDSSKLIKLDSMFFRTTEAIEHLMLDITPGHGRLEGRAVLTINFGTLALQAALT